MLLDLESWYAVVCINDCELLSNSVSVELLTGFVFICLKRHWYGLLNDVLESCLATLMKVLVQQLCNVVRHVRMSNPNRVSPNL